MPIVWDSGCANVFLLLSSGGQKRKWKPPKKKKEPKLKKRKMQESSGDEEEDLENLGDDEDFALKLLSSIRWEQDDDNGKQFC